MSQSNTNEFIVAALGASAGGLEPLETFFRHMPADAGISFVVVQHLAPDRPTSLPDLLTRYTEMPVEQVQDNTAVAPNRIYVIPPNATLTITGGALRVQPPAEARGFRKPIDILFSSLAQDRGENAVCIMLSGTGSDGTLGLRAIKEHGGMAMAQAIETAKYGAILRSAISTGLVDHVIPVEEMPKKLVEYAGHLRSLNGQPNHIPEQVGTQLGKIHSLIRRKAGHDFSQYKESTIIRRMERRMKASQIETVEAYVKLLERTPAEVDLLVKDLLIGVTEFFRDPEAFEALRRDIIPKLFEGKGEGDSVRACVVGCASGEEAYSIGILLCEYASTLAEAPKLQIFATDIDEDGLEMARKGRYPVSVAERVSPERLERFFTKEDDTYQIKRALRERIIFSSHSFIKDPPFSRLDLISCRNVMIYLNSDLQQKVFPLFHYALRSGGYLFLGPAESASSHQELFRAVDKKHRFYQRKDTLPRRHVSFPITDITRPAAGIRRKLGDGSIIDELSLLKQLEQIILRRFRPACVTVQENGDAVYFSGRTNQYLEQQTGRPDTNVVNMAREALRIPLRTALHNAVRTRGRSVQKQIPVPTNGGVTHVDVAVEPLLEIQNANLYMVAFEDSAPAIAPEQAETRVAANGGSEGIIRQLESELHTAEERAQAIYEELETSNEELQSANEEYQSTNEELETSKEELQSFNEELETINTELGRKVFELDQANSDLNNFLDSTQIATIFLDSELRVKKFTPAAEAVFRLIISDVGRPISDLATQFADSGVLEDIKEVLRTLISRERQLTAAGGRYYQMRIMPYRTVHNVIEGTVVTFVDVTPLRDVERRAEAARHYAENIVDTVREPLLVLDNELRVKSANKSFFEKFRLPADETVDKLVFDLGNGAWNIPELRRLMGELLPQQKNVEDFELAYDFPHLGRKQLLLNARRIDHIELILVAIEDITERKRVEDMLRKSVEDLRHFSYAASHDLQEPLRMVMNSTQLLARQYKGSLDKQGDQFIAYAVQGAERIEGLLRDLREYWSVNEQTPSEPVPVDFEQVLTKALDLLALRIEESGGRVTHDHLPMVMAEETPLVLLLQNLIGNALKYRRQGEQPHVHLSAERMPNEWIFSVRDNGIGIEAKYMTAVFAPFKRLHGAEEYAGSGIGLAICQRVVERYHGRIWVESEYGQGSTFRFAIPAQLEVKS